MHNKILNVVTFVTECNHINQILFYNQIQSCKPEATENCDSF